MKEARPAWLLVAVLVLWAMPEAAHAHLVNTGFGPFYDGITYLFVSPANLIIVLAIGILAGLRGMAPARNALFLLTGSWMLGALMSLELNSGDIHLPLVLALVMLGMGLLAALDLRVPTALVSACSIGCGLLNGVLSGAAMAESGGGVRGVLGVLIAVFTIASITAAVVVCQRVGWPRIVVRVAGSWIAAIGLLMAGWALKPV